jgi:hypothetical protein
MMLEKYFIATLVEGENKYIKYPAQVLVVNGEYYEERDFNEGDSKVFSWSVVRVCSRGKYGSEVECKRPKFADIREVDLVTVKLLLAASVSMNQQSYQSDRRGLGELVIEGHSYINKVEDFESLLTAVEKELNSYSSLAEEFQKPVPQKRQEFLQRLAQLKSELKEYIK